MDFIKEYTDYSMTLASSPRKFHEMMAYCLLAQVIGRRPLYFRSGPVIGPNLWVLILAPSSTVAKSSSLEIGKRILRETYNGDFDHLLPIGASSENFFERLAKDGKGILFSSEFVRLLNWFKLSYSREIAALLTECYDQQDLYKSIGTEHKNNKKHYHIVKPFINAYSTSSYSLFNENMTTELLEGGFLARWLIVREDTTDSFKPFTTPPDTLKESQFSEFLRELMINCHEGQFDYDDHAKKIYIDWFETFLNKYRKKVNHTFMASTLTRRNTDIHKIAMINAVLRGSKGIMNSQDIDNALTVAQQSLTDTEFVLNNRLATNLEERDQNRILELVVKFQYDHESGAPHWKVLKNSKMASFQFERVINTLTQSNRITINKVSVQYIKDQKSDRFGLFYSAVENQE